MVGNEEAYNELVHYTLMLGDKEFIHQHVVDAYTAQTATAQTKGMPLFFALAGLWLASEKNYSGRQVQEAHRKMSATSKTFPAIHLPAFRGDLNAASILEADVADERKAIIKNWVKQVWLAYADQHDIIISETKTRLKDL